MRAAECAGQANAILIGPGMLSEDAIRSFMEALLPRLAGMQIVIDAIALSALRGGRFRFTEDTQVVLTPNPAEDEWPRWIPGERAVGRGAGADERSRFAPIAESCSQRLGR